MKPAKFYVERPGLTQSQTEKLAKRVQRAAAEKERRVEVEAPGDVTVTPTMMLTLEGTGTAFDQTYFMESVVHHFSDGGYVMTITAKNSSAGDSGASPSTGDTESAPASDQPDQPSDPGFAQFPADSNDI